VRGLEAAVAKGMQRAALDGVVLEYEVRGSGEPVLLVHAGAFAYWFAPLLAEPSLAQQYALINYHRVSYGGSARPDGPISIADQATHCRMLMGHLGVECACGRPLLWGEHSPAARPRRYWKRSFLDLDGASGNGRARCSGVRRELH
jgi:hypothetical protein